MAESVKIRKVEDFDLLIQQFQGELELAIDSSTRASQFYNLAEVYHVRYAALEMLPDLDNSIENYLAALDLTQTDDPLRPKRLTSLAFVYHLKAMETKEVESMNECIRYLEECSASHHTLPIDQQIILSHTYEMRWDEHEERFEDLNRAIEVLEEFRGSSSTNFSDRDCLVKLGELYVRKFDKTDYLGDLEASLEAFQQALDPSTGDDYKDLDQARALRNHGRALKRRFERLGDLDDIDSSISALEKAVKALPEDPPPLELYNTLTDLAQGYKSKFDGFGSIADLDIATRIEKKAMAVVADDDEFLALGHHGLALNNGEKFIRSNDLKDLDEAILHAQKAWEMTFEGESTAVNIACTLGRLSLHRFEMLGHEDDFEESIEWTSEALSLAQNRSKREQSGILESLSAAHETKYKKDKTLIALETAIGFRQRAVDILPRDDPDLAEHLFALGFLYWSKAVKLGSEESYRIAMKHMHTALEKTPQNDPHRCDRLRHLASQYWQRFVRQKNQADLISATKMLDEAYRHPNASRKDRIHTGGDLAERLMEAGSVSTAYKTAVEVLFQASLLTPRSLEVSDKQNLLKQISGLPALVAALALMANEEPYKAIQHLELGRGVIAGSLSDLRTDILDLETSHPDLAHEFLELRDQLDTTPESMTGFENPRHDAGRRLDSVINNIRGLPGFQQFLLPSSEHELKLAAAQGPIVIINSISKRSDALIIQSDRISSLRLPELHYHIASKYATKPEIDHETLEWLWDTIAEPILENLGYLDMPTDPWPRIFWIPTGLLSGLPIHAAGYHRPGLDRTVIDRVISTYSSSVRSLVQGRRNAARALSSRQIGKAILVGVQELPNAPKEIGDLEEICTDMRIQTQILKPYRDNVLSSLAQCDIFHFAGHGRSHALDPTKSSLEMSDASLTVQDLFNIKLHDRAPYLAYLSACSTGRVEDRELFDESLHLIGACQLAGFRNVIGTLRKVNDAICVHAAKMIYECIKKGNLSDESVARGFHHAIRTLRDQWMEGKEDEMNERGKKKRRTGDAGENKPVSQPTGEDESRGNRDIVACEEGPMEWVPFVYFGI